MSLSCGLRFSQCPPQHFYFCRLIVEPARCVQQSSVSCGINQGAFVVLAVDLDQCAAKQLEDLDADRLVVNKSARATVGELHTAQDQFILHRNIISCEQRPDWVVSLDVKHRRHLALVEALPHKSLIAAATQG